MIGYASPKWMQKYWFFVAAVTNSGNGNNHLYTKLYCKTSVNHWVVPNRCELRWMRMSSFISVFQCYFKSYIRCRSRSFLIGIVSMTFKCEVGRTNMPRDIEYTIKSVSNDAGQNEYIEFLCDTNSNVFADKSNGPNGWKKRHRQHGRAALSARSIRIRRRFADSDTSMRFGRNQNTFFSVFHRSVCTSHWLQFNNNFCIFSLTVRCDKVVLFRIFFFCCFLSAINKTTEFRVIVISGEFVTAEIALRRQENRKREKRLCVRSSCQSKFIEEKTYFLYPQFECIFDGLTTLPIRINQIGKGDSLFGAIFGLQNIWWKCWMDFCRLLSLPIEQVQESILLRLEVTPPSSIEFNSWCLKWQFFFSLSLFRGYLTWFNWLIICSREHQMSFVLWQWAAANHKW